MLKSVIAFKKAISNSVLRKAIASIKLGDFFIVKLFTDVFGATDVTTKATAKVLSDSSAASDAFSSGINKKLTDTSGTNDAVILGVGLNLNNNSSVGDSINQIAIGKLFTDTGSSSDDTAVFTNKTKADAAAVQDVTELLSVKSIAEGSATADSESMQFSKALVDAGAFSDSTLLVPTKVLSDSSVTSELQNMAFHKFVNENSGVTDDLDGEATTNDDQQMTYTKVRSDVAAIADVFAYSTGLDKSDTIGSSDTGFLRGQGYCAFDYFQSDYVGYFQSF